MRDILSWNISLGRWFGVAVRLHVFFVLLMAMVLFQTDSESFWFGLAAIGALFASVMLHEAGHCWAAWRSGGHADQVLLWPFGGLTHVNVSQDPDQELSTSLAGPLVNLVICSLTLPLLVVQLDGWSNVVRLLNPLVAPWPENGFTWVVSLRLVFWINWWLAMVNLLPAFPLDGGRALRALLWPYLGYRTAVLHVVRAAKLTAVALWIVAWLVREEHRFAPLPLAVFGVFLFFSAKQEAQRLQDHDPDDGFLGYDFSQGYTSLERRQATETETLTSPLRRWLEARREARRVRQAQIEADEERLMDDVLARLQEHGLQNLSPEDRALLDRVSARYRNRMQG
ncbi:MAG: hypothetical protein JNM18_24900 [Planctomycetaceae bacterium]|nr:hypothetical protein [Planctomycetaceae bacterium]